MEYIGSTVVADKAELEVYECPCGFHLGIDASYLEQVGDVTIECPSCGELFKTN
jgi:hypothetical protein